MTREEAIICLKGIKNYGRDTFTKQTNCDWQVCLDMAIEALEQEACEDCVSRQAIFENRKRVYERYVSTDNEKAMMEEIARLDEELPSVQPGRTKAKWLDNSDSDGGKVINPFWNRYICSNCGRHSDLENYCANCGSEMEDEE